MDGGVGGVGRGQGVPDVQPPVQEPPREPGIIAWIKRIFANCFKRAQQAPAPIGDHRIVRAEERGLGAAISRLFRKLFARPEQLQVVEQQRAPVNLKSEVLDIIKQSINSNDAITADEIFKALQAKFSVEQCGQALFEIFNENPSDINKIDTNLLRVRNLAEELLKVDANQMFGDQGTRDIIVKRCNDLWIPLVVQTIVNEVRLNPAENNKENLQMLLKNNFDLLITSLSKMRHVPEKESYKAGQDAVKAIRKKVQGLVLEKINNSR